MPDRLNFKNAGFWALQLIVFVVIPLLILVYGIDHIEKLDFNNRMHGIERRLESDLNRLEEASRTEAFLARTFFVDFMRASVATFPQEIIDNLHQKLPDTFNYILWDIKGQIISATIDTRQKQQQWSKAFFTLKEPFIKHTRDLKFSDEEKVNVRELLGPQLVLEGLDVCRSESNDKLLWNDSTGKFPLAWICFSGRIAMLALVSEEKLSTRPGLNMIIKNLSENEYKVGFCNGSEISDPEIIPETDRTTIHSSLKKHSILTPGRIETASAIYYQRVIDENLSIFAVVPNNSSGKGNLLSRYTADVLMLFLLSPVIILLSTEPLTGKKPRISLSQKLGLLFVYSNGLPLAILFFIGYDYISQKEYRLYDDIHARSISFLQNFDERFESEHAIRILKIQKALETLRESLKTSPIKPGHLKKFSDQLNLDPDGRPMRFYLIASDSTTFGNTDYLQKDNRIYPLNSEKYGEEEKKKRSEEYRITQSLFSFILASLNGTPVDSKSATEVELIAESTMQKSVTEVQHEFIAGKGRIAIWGMGTNKHSAFLDFISLSESQKYDYLFMCSWSPGNLEEGYIKRQFLNANRNIEDIEICIGSGESRYILPLTAAKELELRQRMKSFTSKPNETGEIVKFKNTDHLLMGIRGKNLQDYNLAALYPVAEVKQQIYLEKKQLVTAGILSLLLAISLGLLLSHSILFPLKILTGGAEAIQQRNFQIRLPDLGKDEFGSMARLFNESMVDLEELKVAGTVQEHLFPKKLPECGIMKICGRNQSIGDLGGDYFDYFNSSSGQLNLLIGDVTGHGVGAALIMAMAKAAIMQFEDILDNPAEVMKRMNNMILQSNRKKHMSFQYISINTETASAMFSNAGGMPPLIYNSHTQEIREIRLPGEPLGTDIDQLFTNISFKLEPGEALILYTDGIVESCRNYEHKDGHDNLKKLIASSYDSDPVIFCDNILTRIFSDKPADDISLIITTCQTESSHFTEV